MDPIDDWSGSVQEPQSKHPPNQNSRIREESCVLGCPTGRWLLDLQLQLRRTLSKMILFVPFALDMAWSYIFVLKEYLTYVAAASPIAYKTDLGLVRSRKSKLAD